MKKQKEIPTLDDVLNEFMAEYAYPTVDALEKLAKRYPQYRHELIDFASTWAEQLALPPARELGAEQEKVLVDRAMSHVVNVAFSRDEQTLKDDGTPLKSLIDEAKKKGYSPRDFAKACGLDLALISKLNNRQIRPGTIPLRLISDIGGILNRLTTTITDYLAGPPTTSIARAVLPREKPKGPSRQSFADAIRGSSLSSAEKARWLDEAAELGES